LTKDGKFSVKSIYLILKTRQVQCFFKDIWKIKIPWRVKVFMWLTFRGSILTNDNLTHREWTGDKICRLCSCKETIDHLFFQYGIARYIWNVIFMFWIVRILL
jgi:hypothetical protein